MGTHGFRFNDPKNDIEVSHPCRRDYEDIVAHCREVIADLQTPGYYQILAVANDSDGLSQREQSVLDHGLILITARKEKIQFAEEFMREAKNYFGKISVPKECQETSCPMDSSPKISTHYDIKAIWAIEREKRSTITVVQIYVQEELYK
ncbi:hypothetical protein TEQG_00793 [Trichophyton equinum CBS 127.97]|uniref:Uncharacterized protein n=1 Tax=Trichophyton equinum (strain ATCC MYA-4606 / CBS 127.97) TaxID=559882 RepID=F2PII6_TRIEC|nr:hypothetical protein TEQG_00793 [Trichophyton equinum CBS 127.97]